MNFFWFSLLLIFILRESRLHVCMSKSGKRLQWWCQKLKTTKSNFRMSTKYENEKNFESKQILKIFHFSTRLSLAFHHLHTEKSERGNNFHSNFLEKLFFSSFIVWRAKIFIFYFDTSSITRNEKQQQILHIILMIRWMCEILQYNYGAQLDLMTTPLKRMTFLSLIWAAGAFYEFWDDEFHNLSHRCLILLLSKDK